MEPLQEPIECRGTVGAHAPRRLDAFAFHAADDRGDDAADDLVLEGQEIVDRRGKAVGPKRPPGASLDELDVDPQAARGLARRSLDDVFDARFRREALRVPRGTCPGPRDGELTEAGQADDKVVGEAFAEIGLVRARRRPERQHPDARPARRQRIPVPGLGLAHAAPQDPHGLANVLEHLLSHFHHAGVDRAGDRLPDLSGQADAAGEGEALQARRDVHRIAEQVAVVRMDRSGVEADPIGQQAVASGLAPHAPLDGDGTFQRGFGRRELGQDAVPGHREHAAGALLDLFAKDAAARGQRSQRQCLVATHGPAVTDCVRRKYRCRTTPGTGLEHNGSSRLCHLDPEARGLQGASISDFHAPGPLQKLRPAIRPWGSRRRGACRIVLPLALFPEFGYLPRRDTPPQRGASI